jgi:outer membrane immunogenic protein
LIVSTAAVLSSIVGIGAASAADLSYKAAPMAAMAWNWTGWYVGGNVGWGFGDSTSTSLSVVNPGGAGNIGPFLTNGLPGFRSGNLYPSLKPSGVAGGFQFGYDHQFSNNVVLGAVADIQASSLYASATVITPFATTGANVTETLTAKIDWFGTVRAKLGYSFGNWMVYGTGGLAYGDVSSSLGFFCTPGGAGCNGVNFRGSNAGLKTGWTAGVGTAVKLTDHVSVGFEYLHIDLGRSSVTALDTLGVFPTTSITASQHFADDLVRVNLNYKFGGPVLAKY